MNKNIKEILFGFKNEKKIKKIITRITDLKTNFSNKSEKNLISLFERLETTIKVNKKFKWMTEKTFSRKISFTKKLCKSKKLKKTQNCKTIGSHLVSFASKPLGVS